MALRARSSHARPEAAFLLLLAIGALFLFLRKESESVDAANLKIEAAELRSQAVQGALLADGALTDKTTATFFKEQLDLLEDKAGENLKTLSSAKPKKGVEGHLVEAVKLGQEVKAALSNLSASYRERERAAHLKQDCEKLALRLWDLEATLTR
jgi:hypothetical protein